MKPLPIEQVRINLTDLLIEQVLEQSESLFETRLLVAVLKIYRADLVRIRDKRPVDGKHMSKLQSAARLADYCIDEMRISHPVDAEDWNPDRPPRNNVQHVLNVLHNIFADLAASITCAALVADYIQ